MLVEMVPRSLPSQSTVCVVWKMGEDKYWISGSRWTIVWLWNMPQRSIAIRNSGICVKGKLRHVMVRMIFYCKDWTLEMLNGFAETHSSHTNVHNGFCTKIYIVHNYNDSLSSEMVH